MSRHWDRTCLAKMDRVVKPLKEEVIGVDVDAGEKMQGVVQIMSKSWPKGVTTGQLTSYRLCLRVKNHQKILLMEMFTF